jgi:CRP/FNR family transcriptional regulator, cyclic AMP receptor protein
MADRKVDLLRRVPLFAGLGDGDLREVARLADEVDVPAGTALTREGQLGHEFFVIVEGRARVNRNGRKVNELGPGDFLGEIALIDGRPRSATVTTEEPTRLLVLAHREFRSLLDNFPKIERQVLQALADRVRQADPEAS